MPIRHGVAVWPGIVASASCTYTCSHGATPGVAVLETLPQIGAPAEFGDLLIADGVDSVLLRGCKVIGVKSELSGSGIVWRLEISDRRWKWRDTGRIDGCYNQTDPHGKLIPWTIRSPKELAYLCLDAMGESDRALVDMPPGLTEADGQNFADVLKAGQNFEPTGTNPPINWVAEPPAMALARLCEMFGRRLIYQPIENRVIVAISGRGNDLPGGSIARATPALETPNTPGGVGVVGGPTRFQVRLLMEPVGIEWDGSYRPLDLLSYAPPKAGKQRYVSTVTDFAVGVDMVIVINGVEFRKTTIDIGADLNLLVQEINESLDVRVRGVVVASTNSTSTLTVDGLQEGVPFGYRSFVEGVSAPQMTFVAVLTVAVKGGWAACFPPSFMTVQATTRLTHQQARDLAARSVWKCFRLSNIDVDQSNGPKAINVPGYIGRIRRRQQLVLLDTQVEQIVPTVADMDIRDPKNVLLPFVINFYDGYSKDRPAAAYTTKGISYNTMQQGRYSILVALNTPVNSQVLIPFGLDPFWQVMTFTDFVYTNTNSGDAVTIGDPGIILQTAVQVRDAVTNATHRYVTEKHFPNVPDDWPIMYSLHEDVQNNVVSRYEGNRLVNTEFLERDPAVRARHYRDGMEANLLPGKSLTEEYNGIVAIDLDGAISQVTWEVGPGGASTTASQNNEHSIYVPPYPTRRRAENLRAVDRIHDGAIPQNVGVLLVAGGGAIGGKS